MKTATLVALFFILALCASARADQYEDAYRQWKQSDKPMMVLFTGQSCGPCHQLWNEHGDELKRDYIVCRIDVGNERQVALKYGLKVPDSIPACWIFAPCHKPYSPRWSTQSHPHGPWFFMGLPGFRLILNR